MGRPEPCVLFSQTFVHPQLDEYVDEVLFSEPIVITACEFLEQNASSDSQAVCLVGATSPPSFALEAFVQCEGETRFRRLCHPFLYSHSSSNVLEVEAVVTNHLVVRGSYRSLSLVIYGNTAEDLGQFNIDFDDNSLTDLVSSAEGKLEDLPMALHSINRTIEEAISSLKILSLLVTASDISTEVKQLLHLMVKILELSSCESEVHKVVSTVALAASSYFTRYLNNMIRQKHLTSSISKDCEDDLHRVIVEARNELLELLEVLQQESGNVSAESLAECSFSDTEADMASSKLLVDKLSQYYNFNGNTLRVGCHKFPQSKNVILGLSVALLLCSGRESCFHFVNSGGMDQLAYVFSHGTGNSSSITLLLLGVIEQATQHSIGCEGFLGWWPREDENIPSGVSEGYSRLLNLLLQKPHHDVASLVISVLHRLRFYEVASRYESAVLSVMGDLPATGKVTTLTSNMLINARSQLKKLQKLINSRGSIEDPSAVACAKRSLTLVQTEGLLSYKVTSSLIASSICCFSNSDIDLHLLTLLKERGFLTLSAALLSSSMLRSEVGDAMDIYLDIASSIGAVILSLLFSRTGLIFLLHHYEVSATLIHALRGADNMNKEECIPLRYASILISKGFACGLQEIAMIVEMHLRVVNAIDRLLGSPPHSEEFLWVLWELCGLSRSDCGCQALLALGFFPEAVSILIEALHSAKESDPVTKDSGASPLNLAILHSAAEIFEVIVTDSTASSLGSWVGHASELHKALHSSSPGSNRKDAPTRLLEWIDAGVVYHKNGVIGLLRYAAVLASGGDAHLTSTNILVSDLMDVENGLGESGASDFNVMENLVKIIYEKTFDGVTLRDSSIAQLTTALRILAFISEDSSVAAALYDEGAITIIYAILVNCRFMLERFSNSYDYLVDDGTECNSSSDLLLERNREQSIVDLLVPSLVLLITLLQKLQEAKEQHKNTKLMNALLRLHREVSPKLAACAADLSSPFPDSALGFGTVCHLVVSALAFWPIHGWTPGLFHFLFVGVQTSSLLALGPKETCSLLCLLNDLFPEEGIWLWRNGMPLLSALRTLAVGSLLGPQKEKEVDWYLESGHLEKLLIQLRPHLDKIAQIIQHYAISALVVIQDMLRVLIIRISCQKAENASVLLCPILSWIRDRASDPSTLSDVDVYKGSRFLDFLASLLEHPHAKALLLKDGVVQMLTEVLERCFDAADSNGIHISDHMNSAKFDLTIISWCLPVFKCFSLLCSSRTPLKYPMRHDSYKFVALSTEDCSLILPYVLKFAQVLPVGKELVFCLAAFKELVSCNEGRSALLSTLCHTRCTLEEVDSVGEHERSENLSLNELEWKNNPPLLCCWTKLSNSIDSKDGLSAYEIEAISALTLGSLHFCIDGKSLSLNGVVALRYLFGLPDDKSVAEGSTEENIKYIKNLVAVLSSKINGDTCDMETTLCQVSGFVKALLLLLERPTGSVKVDDIIFDEGILLSLNDFPLSSNIHHMEDGDAEKADDHLYLVGHEDKFLWECPETLPERLSQGTLPSKRKMPPVEGLSRRTRGENSLAETPSQNTFSRGLGPSTTPSGPTRRDTFRQRKPNTSRAPSLHVDDYIAKERSIDGVSNSNVIVAQRVGSAGGRAPSVHVDEFMARERERQKRVVTVVGEAVAQVKSVAPTSDTQNEKVDKSKQLKTDLDDDLQGIDIVFDDEESEPDDNLPFPQLDDNLQQPAPVMVEQSSPHSIVEETESDVNENSQFSRLGPPLASKADENTQSEFFSRMSVSRPEVQLTREPSVSSDQKYFDQSDDSKNVITVKTSGAFDSGAAANNSGLSASPYNNAPMSSMPVDSRMTQHNYYPKNSPQHAGNFPVAAGSRGLYDQKVILNQPPLPPMPPPQTISPVISQASDSIPSQSSPYVKTIAESQLSIPAAFQVQADYISVFGGSSTPLSSSLSGGSARPPLPPTPPPFSCSPYNLPSLKTSTSQLSVYNHQTSGGTEMPQAQSSASAARLSSYHPPPLMPPLVFSRPASMPGSLYGGTPTQQQGENPPSILPNLSIPQSSIQSMHSLTQLQPLQPPQVLRPQQPPLHLRPPMQASQQLDPGMSMQSPARMQVHPLQIMQPPHVSPIHSYYSSQQQEFSPAQQRQQQQIECAQPQVLHQQGDVASQQQQDLGMSLHEYFKSPEAIQSLLSDRDKLCQLLEQHPKLMQMLQVITLNNSCFKYFPFSQMSVNIYC
ncbi:hypothetical protein Ddye_008414 [Dipteronia dyeriana]|uniref:Virilizer N-terminal domain-containing protein n=1 Tax=Dipteronia dyeriana TaxID=168575 RepID=A0AAE0CLA9_9ROSI|nr:hypothetical protein Ddye_008414 [Dipteronia dyeriana]